MLPYRIFITPTAIIDIDEAVAYYNSKSEGLGSGFQTRYIIILPLLHEIQKPLPCDIKMCVANWLERSPF
jgi:hypothetical protein